MYADSVVGIYGNGKPGLRDLVKVRVAIAIFLTEKFLNLQLSRGIQKWQNGPVVRLGYRVKMGNFIVR